MYFERDISKIIIETSETFPVVLLTGPRQVGKSTVLEKIREENRSLVTLDDPSIRVLAQTDPALFCRLTSLPC